MIGTSKRRKAIYEDFILPIKTFLHTSGYFGIVNIEILEKEGRRYLVDLNCRLPGVLAQLFIAPYMAKLGYPMSLTTTSKTLGCTRKELFSMAEEINEQGPEKIIVLAAADVDGVFKADLAVFAETMAGIQVLTGTLEQNNNCKTKGHFARYHYLYYNRLDNEVARSRALLLFISFIG